MPHQYNSSLSFPKTTAKLRFSSDLLVRLDYHLMQLFPSFSREPFVLSLSLSRVSPSPSTALRIHNPSPFVLHKYFRISSTCLNRIETFFTFFTLHTPTPIPSHHQLNSWKQFNANMYADIFERYEIKFGNGEKNENFEGNLQF